MGLVLLALTTIAPVHATALNESNAPEVVDRFHAALLAVMKQAKVLKYAGRYKRLQPWVRRSFDLPRVVRIVAGPYWRRLRVEQKRRFIQVFTRLVIATYAHRFDGYSGERFVRMAVRRLSHGNVLVRTVIIKHDGKRVHLDYVLHRRDQRWRIINVIADGVSDLALKRAEYTAVLGSQGFESLMAKLEAKIVQYESKPD